MRLQNYVWKSCQETQADVVFRTHGIGHEQLEEQQIIMYDKYFKT